MGKTKVIRARKKRRRGLGSDTGGRGAPAAQAGRLPGQPSPAILGLSDPPPFARAFPARPREARHAGAKPASLFLGPRSPAGKAAP